jgi:hypothetical protein
VPLVTLTRGAVHGVAQVYLVGGAAALLTLRYILIVLFFEPIALRLMCLKGRVLSKEDRQGLNKFIKYQWHCLVYIVLLVWGWKIMFEMPWTPWNKGDIDSMWHGYPHHAASEKLPAKAFYMAQVAPARCERARRSLCIPSCPRAPGAQSAPMSIWCVPHVARRCLGTCTASWRA